MASIAEADTYAQLEANQDTYSQLEANQPAEESSGSGHAGFARHSYGGVVPQVDHNAFMASGKALDYLLKMEHDGSLGLEKASVYGAAVALPQIARSAGWSGTMMALAVRSYFFLFLNIFLQGFLLTMIGEEANIMQPFAGQMHLCDFGASMDQCPSGPNCHGPGGTEMSYPRLYDYDTWSTRIFVKESLKTLFPDRADDIDGNVDPGEYGIEDFYCRTACCIIFSMAVMNDLYLTFSLAQLLYYLPSNNDKWIRYEAPTFGENKSRAKEMFGWTELHLVKFGVAGLPLTWKIINILIVFLPKLLLWILFVNSGFHFLMETAGIVDLIMNSLAMTFILSIDELIFEVLTTVPVRHMMANLEDYQLFSFEEHEAENEDECLTRYVDDELGTRRLSRFFKMLLPRRLIAVALVTVIFTWRYYRANCVLDQYGGWVSIPMHLPKRDGFSPMSFALNSLAHMSSKTFWSMPGEGHHGS